MELIDFSSDREDGFLDWREAVKFETDLNDLPLWERCKLVFESAVLLPNPELQVPLILAYALTPSAMATRMPIAFFYGGSGSGKSMAGIFCSNLYRFYPLQESSTTASIRNELNSRKWVTHPDSPDIRLEQNFILVWDDLRPNRISPDSIDGIFSILKSGCSRQTSKTNIALPGGKVMEFCTFGGKVISSIHPLWSVPGADELRRRSLIFKFQKSETLEPLNLETVDITELSCQLKAFWTNRENREKFKYVKRKLSNLKSNFDNNFKTFCLDILATFCVFTDAKTRDAISLLDSYNAFLRTPLLSISLTDEILDNFLNEKRQELDDSNKLFLDQGLTEFVEREFYVKSADLIRMFRERMIDGSVELKIDNSTLHQLMQSRGFVPVVTKDGVYWYQK